MLNQPYGMSFIAIAHYMIFIKNFYCRIVALNGAPLFLNDDNSFPPLTAEERDPKNYLSLQALSFGFVVFKNSKIKACLY